jgi:hypothetical protein
MENDMPNRVSRLLEEAERLAREGKWEKAYRASLELTNLAPHEPSGWLLRSQTAPSQEEQLVCLSRVYSLNPGFPQAKGGMHAALRNLIKQEPSLTYVAETKDLYQVRSGLDLLLNVPKNRAYDELYLKRPIGPLKAAYSWLNMALFTLFLGGVGAFFLAPITALRALLLQRHIRNPRDRVRVTVIVIISAMIWLASIPLGLLFLIHFVSWGG